MILYQILYRTIGFFLLFSVPFAECTKVHELMTDDEIMYLFQTTRDEVPEYEMVVMEYSLHERSNHPDFTIKFKAFDMDVEAYLNPVDGVLVGEDTPVWVAKTLAGKTRYRKLKRGIMKEVLGVYQGVSDRAALVVRSQVGQDLQFHGTIQDLTVIPLPYHIEQAFRKPERTKRDLSETRDEVPITKCHIVFKSNRTVNQTAAAQQSTESTVRKNRDTLKQNDTSKSKRSYKSMVFPTILVTTDFNVAVKSRDDSAYYDQIMYQMAFWNGVDLRFRHLNNPGVRLRIAGLVIGLGRSATPYLKQNMDDGEINTYPAHDDMEAYYGSKRNTPFSPGSFHIVATVTNLNMFAEEESGSKVGLEGLARTSSICEEYEGEFYPSMLFRDDLGFGGINVAVHELGHILGANHDDQDECPSSDGYLMSPTISKTVNNLKWSHCSLESITRTLRLHNCTDKPKEHFPLGNPLKRVLPGALKTADEQCRARGYDRACKTSPGICKVLRCYFTRFRGFHKTSSQCHDSWSAAEGTECAPGSHCIDGECLFTHNEVSQRKGIRGLLKLLERVLLGSKRNTL